jgi:hypothetical protein
MILPPTFTDLRQTVRQLAEQVRAIEGRRPVVGEDRIGSGCPPLDRLLPERGLRRGTLVEWLSAGRGNGADLLALLAAREVCRAGGMLVIVDRQKSFYPPGALCWGIDLRQLMIVRPTDDADDAWAWDQSLRSPAVAAVWGWPHPRDEQTLRRWQLAAEASGTIGLLLRPNRVRSDPSWAELRLLVQPLVAPHQPGEASRRRLRVELLRARSAIAGGSVTLELNEENAQVQEVSRHDTSTHRLPLVAQLAHPATRQRRLA